MVPYAALVQAVLHVKDLYCRVCSGVAGFAGTLSTLLTSSKAVEQHTQRIAATLAEDRAWPSTSVLMRGREGMVCCVCVVLPTLLSVLTACKCE